MQGDDGTFDTVPDHAADDREVARAAALGPGPAEAASLRAQAYAESERGRHEAAIAAARRAVALDDGTWAHHQALLEVLLAAGRPAEAVGHGHDVISAGRHAHRVNTLHARALAATGDRSGAETFFRRALELVPGDGAALLGLAALRARRSPYEALRSVVAASSLDGTGSPAARPAAGAAARAAGEAIGRAFAVRLAALVAGLVLVVVPLLGLGRGSPLPSAPLRTFTGAVVVGLLAGCWIPVRLLPPSVRREVTSRVLGAAVATSPVVIALLVVAFGSTAAARFAADALRLVFRGEVIVLVPVGLLVVAWGVLVLVWHRAEASQRSRSG